MKKQITIAGSVLFVLFLIILYLSFKIRAQEQQTIPELKNVAEDQLNYHQGEVDKYRQLIEGYDKIIEGDALVRSVQETEKEKKSESVSEGL